MSQVMVRENLLDVDLTDVREDVKIGEYTITVNGVDFEFVVIRKANQDLLEIQKYPMTQAQFEALGMKNQSRFREACGCNGSNPKNLPVENVTWFEAMEAGKRLSELTGREGFTLPDERDWEMAARADTPSFEYAGSNDPDEVAWHSGNSGGHTHCVGEKKPNSWGLHDMSGNVWEWTSTKA